MDIAGILTACRWSLVQYIHTKQWLVAKMMCGDPKRDVCLIATILLHHHVVGALDADVRENVLHAKEFTSRTVRAARRIIDRYQSSYGMEQQASCLAVTMRRTLLTLCLGADLDIPDANQSIKADCAVYPSASVSRKRKNSVLVVPILSVAAAAICSPSVAALPSLHGVQMQFPMTGTFLRVDLKADGLGVTGLERELLHHVDAKKALQSPIIRSCAQRLIMGGKAYTQGQTFGYRDSDINAEATGYPLDMAPVTQQYRVDNDTIGKRFLEQDVGIGKHLLRVLLPTSSEV
jgi:hypothetical protein